MKPSRGGGAFSVYWQETKYPHSPFIFSKLTGIFSGEGLYSRQERNGVGWMDGRMDAGGLCGPPGFKMLTSLCGEEVSETGRETVSPRVALEQEKGEAAQGPGLSVSPAPSNPALGPEAQSQQRVPSARVAGRALDLSLVSLLGMTAPPPPLGPAAPPPSYEETTGFKGSTPYPPAYPPAAGFAPGPLPKDGQAPPYPPHHYPPPQGPMAAPPGKPAISPRGPVGQCLPTCWGAKQWVQDGGGKSCLGRLPLGEGKRSHCRLETGKVRAAAQGILGGKIAIQSGRKPESSGPLKAPAFHSGQE